MASGRPRWPGVISSCVCVVRAWLYLFQPCATGRGVSLHGRCASSRRALRPWGSIARTARGARRHARRTHRAPGAPRARGADAAHCMPGQGGGAQGAGKGQRGRGGCKGQRLVTEARAAAQRVASSVWWLQTTATALLRGHGAARRRPPSGPQCMRQDHALRRSRGGRCCTCACSARRSATAPPAWRAATCRWCCTRGRGRAWRGRWGTP